MIVVAVVGIVVIALDQVSKIIVAGNETLHSLTLIPGFFHITYCENTGMAWSLFSGHQQILALISAVAIGVMIWYVIDKRPDKLTTFGLALMIGGATGNLIDRLILGYVRDFLDFYPFGYDFPVFNIADSALCIGVAFLFIAILLEDTKEKNKA